MPASAAPPLPPTPPVSLARARRVRLALLAGIVTVATVLLFARLGHYALWDDEAATALMGRAVWQYGDTYMVLGQNVVADRGGMVLKNLHERYTSPLSAYLVAPFTTLMGGSAGSVRLPMALLGLGAVLLLLGWCWQAQADARTLLVFGVALLGNVSFFLFYRQCRYYAPAACFTLALAYVYLHRRGRRWEMPLFGLLALLLFASNYLNFAACFACLGVDYLLWGRRERSLTWRAAAEALLPVAVLGGLIVAIWNPLSSAAASGAHHNGVLMRLYLLVLLARDLNRCELGSGLLLATPLLYLWRRQVWLLRGALCLAVYLAGVALLSPQEISLATVWADTRYLPPVIPLCLALGTLTLLTLCQGRWAWLALVLAPLFFLTNLTNDNWRTHGWRCTLYDYAGELAHPNPEPYTPLAQWLAAHVPSGGSVWVQPAYMMYPLLYHAPHAVYAWQLTYPPAPQFARLPLIHFAGQSWPDFVVGCGPFAKPLVTDPAYLAHYRLVDMLPVYWHDAYRPELYWHEFHPRPCRPERGEALYLFQRRD